MRVEKYPIRIIEGNSFTLSIELQQIAWGHGTGTTSEFVPLESDRFRVWLVSKAGERIEAFNAVVSANELLISFDEGICKGLYDIEIFVYRANETRLHCRLEKRIHIVPTTDKMGIEADTIKLTGAVLLVIDGVSLQWDDTPTEGSGAVVTSDGIYHALQELREDFDNAKIEVDEELDGTSENPVQNKVVAAAIERLNAEVFPFKITLNGGGSTYELGSSQTVNLSWQYTDSDIDSQMVNGETVAKGTNQKQYTNVSSDTTYRLQVVYKGADYEKSTSVSFKLRKYWGTSAKTSLDSSDIIAMSKEFASDYKLGEKTLNCQGGKYIYFIVPASFAPVSFPDFRVGGFANSNWEETTQTVTNASGNSSSYKIYRLRDIQTGDSITLQVK